MVARHLLETAKLYRLMARGLLRRRRWGRNPWSHREFLCDDKRKIAYLILPKCACSSIRKSFFKQELKDDGSIHHAPIIDGRPTEDMTDRGRLSHKRKDYFTFSFTRNPFDRLASLYADKVAGLSAQGGSDPVFYLRGFYLYGALAEKKNFDDFLHAVIRIPDSIAEHHFRSQYDLLYEKGKILTDYVGKIEAFPESFAPIREKYDLEPLAHFHPTRKGDWRNFFTEKSAQLCYRRYKKDFQTFGYEEELPKLLDFLKNRGKG